MLHYLVAQTTTLTVNGQEVDNPEGFFAVLVTFFLTFILLFIVLYVVYVIALWKIFEKAGVEGWKAIVPIYNAYVLAEIAGKPGWWALVGLTAIIPIVGVIGSIASIVLSIIIMLELGKSFGKSNAFSIVALVIFSFVGTLILGFGSDKYIGPGGVAQGNANMQPTGAGPAANPQGTFALPQDQPAQAAPPQNNDPQNPVV